MCVCVCGGGGGGGEEEGVGGPCLHKKKVTEKSRECHNHKPQPFPDTKRKRK